MKLKLHDVTKTGDNITVLARVLDDTGKGVATIEGVGKTKDEAKAALQQAFADYIAEREQKIDLDTLGADVIAEINAELQAAEAKE